MQRFLLAVIVAIALAAPLALTARTVAAAPLSPTDAAAITDTRALLLSAHQTTLAAQFSGKILRMPTTPGYAFHAGEVLVQFQCGEQHAKLNVARAELLAARQTYLAKLRLQGLNAASQLEVGQAAADVEKSRGELALAQSAVEQCRIRAPFAGRVAKLAAQPFETVSPGQPLLEIVDASHFKVKVIMPSRWLMWVRPGTRFQVHIDENGKTYNAEVTHINGRVDPVSQTIDLEGKLISPHHELLPGMSGTATFLPAPHRASVSGQ